MKKQFIIGVFTLLFAFSMQTLKAQFLTLPADANFFDYLEAFYNSDSYNPLDTTEGGEKAQHERLSHIWGTRLYPHGDFSIANKAIIDYAEDFEPVNERNENPNWICLGPSDNPTNSDRNGVGQIHRITFDPNYGISNQTVYACTGHGGLWRTENDGELWENVNTDFLPMATVADVAINPNNSQMIFIATGHPDGGVTLQYSPNWSHVNPIYTIGIYRSTDYGNTWHPINSGFIDDFYTDGGTVRKLTIDNNNPNILFAATSNGIYLTQNALDNTPNWTKVYEGITDTDNDFRSVEFKPGSSNVIYAASSNIFKSTNGGNTWSAMTGSTTGLDFESMEPFYPFRINLAITPAANEKLYAYIWGDDETLPNPGGYDNKSVYIYIYDGNLWSEFQEAQAHGYNAKEWMGFAVSPVDDESFFAYGDFGNSCLAGVYGTHPQDPFIPYTTYIGSNFYADGHVLAFQPNTPNNPKLFFGHHAGVSVLDVQNFEYEFRNTGLQNMLQWAFDDSEFTDSTAITANQDCKAYFYSGNEWKSTETSYDAKDTYSAQFSKVDTNLFYTSSGDEIIRAFRISSIHFGLPDPRPYDGEHPGSEALISKTFQVKGLPNDTSDYFSFSEIYKRNYDWSDGHSANELWEIDSDIGKIEDIIWKRQITELDYCQSNPDYIYIATGGGFSEEGGILTPTLARTTIGGNNGNYSGIDAYDQIDYSDIYDDDLPIISGIAVHPVDPDKVWISLIGYDNIDIRVARTDDGGQNWVNADPNNSLPELPVNNIMYQYGSNDVIYIATDVGVYYKDATMANWEEYGDFPHVRVTELKINYCQNKLRAATFGRSLWEADLLPMENPVCYEIKTGETMVWSKPKTLQTGVRIKSGGELIITGQVFMPKEGNIIVEQGGKLIIDGGIVTNGCGEYWKGIQVWGDINEHQFEYTGHPCAQGKLILKNNAVIENAWDAVTLWKPGDYNSSGGIIIAQNSWFKNNKRAVEFMSYQNFSPGTGEPTGYYSNFKNCDFIVDDNYIVPSEFSAHITMWDVYNISIKGCRFSNQISDAQNTGNGIYTASAAYWLTNHCTETISPCPEASIRRNTFSNFYAALQGYNNPTSVNTIYANDAVFTNNSYGIKLNAVDNATIINSEFNIGFNTRDETSCLGKSSCVGIELTGCMGFAIEENTFLSNSGPFGRYTVGTSIAQTNAPYDEVYFNQYNNLSMANYTEGKNWEGIDIQEGLAFYCNENTGNWADVYVTEGEGYEDAGVQSQQGDLNNSAGNEFTATGAEWHFYNGGDYNVDYYYCTSCPGQEPELIEYVTPHATSNINDCPSHYGGGGDEIKMATSLTQDELLLLEQDYAANLSLYNNVQALYEDLKDGGNTEALVEEVETSWPGDMWELRAELLGDSPHLSMEVLKQAADKTDVLPESVQFEILAANPDELKKKELIDYLENKEEPLPQYMIDILKEVANGTTYKTVLLKQMSGYNQQKMRAAYDIIRSKVHDTITDMEGLRNWLDNVGGVQADEQIIATYLQQGNTTDALLLAQLMPQLYKLEGKELDEHGFYTDMLNLHINLKQEDRNIFMLESDEMELLEYLADSSYGTAGMQARGLLEFAYGHHYPNCIECGDTTGMKSATVTDESYNKLYGIDISVQPNPAKGWAEFNFTLPNETSEGMLNIYDVPGRLVESIAVQGRQGQKLWDTRKVKAGIYIYKLDALGTSKTGKIVIQH